MIQKLYLFVILAVCAASGYAQSWEGAGTEEEPYLITSVEQFREYIDISNAKTEDFANVHFRLTADLDLAEWCAANGAWTGLASGSGSAFKSHFHGGGHVVKNLYMRGIYSGLFGAMRSGSIDSLIIADADIVGGASGIIGFIGTANYEVNISNCYATAKGYGTATGAGETVKILPLSFTNNAGAGTFTNCYIITPDGAFNTAGALKSVASYAERLYEPPVAERQAEAHYLAKDFDIQPSYSAEKVWNIWEGKSYPYFRYQSAPAVITAAGLSAVSGEYRADDVAETDSIVISVNGVRSGTAILYSGGGCCDPSENGTWEYSWPAPVAEGDTVQAVVHQAGRILSYPVVAFVGSATGISPVKDNETGAAFDPVVESGYYTVSGAKVSRPLAAGVYIRRDLHRSGAVSVTKILY